MNESPTIKFANTEIRIQTAGIAILATVAIGATLKWLGPVLVPFILAVFFVCGIAPIIDYFQRRLGASRLVAAAITFLLGLILLVLFWMFIWMSVASLVDQAPAYRARLKELVDRASQVVPMDMLGLPGRGKADPPLKGAEKIDDGEDAPVASSDSPGNGDEPNADDLQAERGEAGSNAAIEGEDEAPFTDDEPSVDLGGESAKVFMQYVQKLSEGLPALLGSAVMMMIFMFFLLLGESKLNLERPKIWNEIEAKVRNYIVTKTLISLATGAAVAVVLWAFGIPLALVFGLLAFLLNFIPNVGPLIMCVLPLPLILLDPDLGIVGMVTVIVLTSGIQFVSGNVIETKIMGDSFELHPVVVLLTLMLWGMIWDIPGMFLATPITAAIKILLEKFEYTRPIAELMAGRFDSLERLGKGPEEEQATA